MPATTRAEHVGGADDEDAVTVGVLDAVVDVLAAGDVVVALVVVDVLEPDIDDPAEQAVRAVAAAATLTRARRDGRGRSTERRYPSQRAGPSRLVATHERADVSAGGGEQ
jgi:sugar/nucleoside kinase (ribokinase family)